MIIKEICLQYYVLGTPQYPPHIYLLDCFNYCTPSFSPSKMNDFYFFYWHYAITLTVYDFNCLALIQQA